MPLILTERSPEFGTTYLWHMTEEIDFFRAAILSTGLDISKIESWHPRRQREWLASRYLVHRYAQESLIDFTKDQYGKPQFRDSATQISISHTGDLAGLMLHPSISIGLDLQVMTDKVERVAHKFCHEEEVALLASRYTLEESRHFIWGMKESMFKAYGKGRLSYLNHLRITSIMSSGSSCLCTARLQNGEETISYLGKLRRLGAYYWIQLITNEE